MVKMINRKDAERLVMDPKRRLDYEDDELHNEGCAVAAVVLLSLATTAIAILLLMWTLL